MRMSIDEALTETALSKWIDTNVLAENILDALREAQVRPTIQNGQKVWLDILYTELPEALRVSVAALANKSEIH